MEEEIDLKTHQAFSIVRNVFISNKECRKALVASIESSLRESTIVWEEWGYKETAKKIADRIIGMD